MTNAHGILLATLIAIMGAAMSLAAGANAADAILSGTITSAAGEKLGGVTVSAKPVGGTVTTTVFTDANGEYYFPPLPAGKYRLWAQAICFQTVKAGVDLPATSKHGFVLDPIKDFVRQLPGNVMLSALPEGTEQDKRMKRLVRNICTGCLTASYAHQHRFHEAGWNAIIELMKNANVYGTFMGNERKPSGILDYHQKELAAYLARARTRRKRHEVYASSASLRGSGARHVQGVRRPARSGRGPAEQLRAERRQRLVARDAVRPHPGLGRARCLARPRRPALVYLQHPEPTHHHRQDR